MILFSGSALKTLWEKNQLYFSLFIIIWTIGMVLSILLEKGEVVVFFSEHRTSFWNAFFTWGTKLAEVPAFVAVAIFLLFFQYRHALAVVLLGGLVTLISYFTKKLFHVPRPRAYFESLGQFSDLNIVEGVAVHGGATSFPSGHTMAGFALFTFLMLCLKSKPLATTGFLLLALIVGISRIYLMQHFLEDVLMGSWMGVIIAMLWYQFQLGWGKEGSGWTQNLVGTFTKQSAKV